MRDIKFRGKCILHNEWKYGQAILHSADETVIIKQDELKPSIYPIFSVVEKDTIGQYTGLKDMNGVEIYEGDLLSNEKGEIIMSTFEITDSHSIFKFINEEKPTTLYCNISKFFKVIGNIHDKESE